MGWKTEGSFQRDCDVIPWVVKLDVCEKRKGQPGRDRLGGKADPHSTEGPLLVPESQVKGLPARYRKAPAG